MVKELKLKKKVSKDLPEGFAEDMARQDSQAVKDVIVGAAVNISQLEDQKKDDQKIQALKEDLASLTAAFKDAIKANKAKIKFCAQLLKERGAN